MKKYLIAIAVLLFSIYSPVRAAEKVSAKSTAGKATSGKTTIALAQTLADPFTGMEFVLVKGGCYKMGSVAGSEDEIPQHDVCVDDFYLGKYEVTQAQWKKVMESNPSQFSTCGPDCPVDSVSWSDSQEFVKKLSAQAKKKYRLPTEAEWEYAARSGGRDEKYAGTSDQSRLGEFAWIRDNAGDVTHQVGQKSPNGLGLYDMTGNVDEWCQDRYDKEYYKNSPKKNPAGPNAGDERASRGGAYDFSNMRIRAAHRRSESPDFRDNKLGLRLLLPVK